MHTKNNTRTCLSVESLEDRTVPTYFGASGGESIAIGAVLSPPGVGPNDIITGTGPGTPGLVRITSSTNQLLFSFEPFGASFKGGVYVASADVTGDGMDDLIVSTGVGTVGTVKVFEFINGGMQQISSFTPFGPNYVGGVDIAAGNVTGEVVSASNPGVANQIVVGMAHGGSTVRVFGFDDSSGTPQYDMIRSFQAYAPGFTGGVTLAVADIDTQVNSATDPVNHDYASIITGMATTLPEVAIFNAQDPTVTLRAEYMAFNPATPSLRTGINVAAGDTDGERGAEIYVNLRGTGIIKVFNGQTSALITMINTYPPAFGTMVNMAIGGVTTFAPTQDDEVTPTFSVRDLVVVAGNISVNQVPVDEPGEIGKPAGLNGSHAL
jgi:hypothetical protein